MTIDEFVAWVKSNPENAKAKAFASSLDALTADKIEGFFDPKLSADIVKPWIESEAGASLLQSKLDRSYAERLAKFRETELPKLQSEYFETEYAKKHPPTSEAEKQLAEIQRKFADMERDKTLAELRAKAIQAASGKKLPADLVDLLKMDDEEMTLARIEKLSEIMTASTNAAVDERMKSIKPEPRQSGTNSQPMAKVTPGMTRAEILDATYKAQENQTAST